MKQIILFLFFAYVSNSYCQELVVNDSIYSAKDVDVKPEYIGGVEKFYNFVKNNFNPPEKGNGKVIIEFVIEKDGSLSNFDVTEDVGYGSAEEVLRVFQKMPKWNPGKKDDQIVRTLYRFPISIFNE